MRKAIIIVGLPGSGKSTFAKALGGRLVDDASQNEEELKAALASEDELVVVTDVNAVYSRRETIEAMVNRHGREVEIICYENDPDACWINLCRRGDNKVSRGGLIQMSKAYKIGVLAPSMLLPVYSA